MVKMKKRFCELLNRRMRGRADDRVCVCVSVFRAISEKKAARGEGVAAIPGEGLAG